MGVEKWEGEIRNPQLVDPRIEKLCGELLVKISNPLEISQDLNDCVDFITKMNGD